MIVKLGGISDSSRSAAELHLDQGRRRDAGRFGGRLSLHRRGPTRIDYFAYTMPDGFTAYPVKAPQCQFGDRGFGAIPVSPTNPNGMAFDLGWDFVEKCAGYDEDLACIDPAAFVRFRGVTSSAGYGFIVNSDRQPRQLLGVADQLVLPDPMSNPW